MSLFLLDKQLKAAGVERVQEELQNQVNAFVGFNPLDFALIRFGKVAVKGCQLEGTSPVYLPTYLLHI